jgi:hypothetical protein
MFSSSKNITALDSLIHPRKKSSTALIPILSVSFDQFLQIESATASQTVRMELTKMEEWANAGCQLNELQTVVAER